MKSDANKSNKSAKGFSAVELLVVLAIIAVMSAISIPYLLNYKKGYRSEDQMLKMIDVMRETAQLALQKRRTFRFEIDLTDNEITIIDENDTAADVQIKNVPLEMTKQVRVDMIPVGVTKQNPPNYTDITFAVDSLGHLEGSTDAHGPSLPQLPGPTTAVRRPPREKLRPSPENPAAPRLRAHAGPRGPMRVAPVAA